MYLNIVIFYLLIALTKAQEVYQQTNLDKLLTIKLYHSINSPDSYKLRGTIIIPSSKEKDLVIKQDKPLTDEEINDLDKAARNNGFYFLKAVAYKSTSEDQTKMATSFIEACSLVQSGLSDIIMISLDYYGNLIGISLTSTNPTCESSYFSTDSSNKLDTFNTTVKLISTTLGPVPDTLSYIQRMEQEKNEKLRGDKVDNRSFFGKYWMYIVPVVIFVLISNLASPEGMEQAAAR
ncbi:ER membrane protein complex subunit 10 [Tetranychus urticae]|uniref:ER membrane protein complex subunit 10 n=1 Tax=Tetranychus urticae TaxID=32264 RepID=T1KK52_TETUR|nr:ER membrane protein complex subunit 10 [Tetranychus urticae]